MKIKLTQEQIDTMSYDDVAFLILEVSKKQLKIQDLFKKVIEAMKLPEEEFTDGIGEFFELLLTDKRFTMLENGTWDLKIKHSAKIKLKDIDEDDDDEDEIEEDEIHEVDADEEEINYDEENIEDDDEEDDLKDLVILDEEDDML